MEKVWLASYPEGVPELIPDPPYSSLTDMMNASMKKYASRKAYTNMGSSITFGELDELSNGFAYYLLYELNLKKGDRVLFGKYSGTEVKVGGDEYLVMREDDIMGVVE